MFEQIYYRQCKLRQTYMNLLNKKPIDIIEVTYIPEKYAVMGKHLRLWTDDEWTGDWEVIAVSSIRYLSSSGLICKWLD